MLKRHHKFYHYVAVDSPESNQQYGNHLQPHLAGEKGAQHVPQNNGLLLYASADAILLVVSGGLSIFMSTMVKNLEDFTLLAPVGKFMGVATDDIDDNTEYLMVKGVMTAVCLLYTSRCV